MDKKYLGLLAIPIILGLLIVYSHSRQGESVDIKEEGGLYTARVCVCKNDEEVSCSSNILTDAGAELIEGFLRANSGTGACTYIALSSDAHTPAEGDTTLVGEITTGGLERAPGTATSVAGDGAWHVNKTFTASDSFTGVRLSGIFNQGSGGVMLAENDFTSTNLQASDQITISWQFDIIEG